ncbi:DMT family transporter [Nocardioides nematodiphilus]|uniref:DMT family transporter n=1 Tax=Nocardioides nematodiphilus TaxID=2849669 RepID=UPI001CD9AC9D|nr:DMT family transporter [Nocardioides nematodiphilus]MCA1981473.1 DMT family transporter [Nocardioides nematodiphilus]
MTPSRSLPLIAVGVTLLLWASAFVAIRDLADEVRPGAMALGRLAVGALCLGVVALRRRPVLVRPDRADWWRILAIGVLWYALYMVALNAGERRIDAGTAAMLIQLSPILIAVLAAIFLDERFTRWIVLGLALAFGGVILISFAGHGSDGGRDLLGVVLCLVSAVAYSISLILQKPLMSRLASVQVTWLACTIGAVVCLPFAGQLISDLRDAPLSATLWVIYLGVFPTAIAFTTYGYALSHMSASSLGITTYLVPVITVLLAWAWLGETPPGLAYVGGALALLGVAVARRRPA